VAKKTPEPATGYLKDEEDRDLLEACCIDFDIMSLSPLGDVPDTRGIKDKMRRTDQGRINSCGGFGFAHAAQVAMFNQTQVWRYFHAMWSYRRAQEESGIRGDRGSTITGLVKAGKKGILPEDFDGDGQPETVYRPDYDMRFPDGAAAVAAQWRVGYSLSMRTFDEMLRFMQTGQGAVVIGGSWGNWRPDANGIANTYRGGGGGHARAYVDWITIRGKVHLVEANSHGTRYGDKGFAYHTKKFVDTQGRSSSFSGIGISDMQHPEVRRVVPVDEWNRRTFAGGLPRPF